VRSGPPGCSLLHVAACATPAHLTRPTRLAMLVAATVWLAVIVTMAPWRGLQVINSDAYGYTRYLVAALSPHGLTSARTFDELGQAYPQLAPGTGYGAHPLPDGTVAFKYTMGMAVMHAPLFLSAHVYARWTGRPSDGFSGPYQVAIALSNWLWSVLALVVTGQLLLRWFSERVSAVVLLLLAFGTNAFYYSALTFGMTHMPSMCLFGATLLAALSWLERPRPAAAVLVGAGLGLIGLVRPTDLVFALIPMAVYLRHLASQPADRRRYTDVALSAAAALLVFTPQLIYWQLTTGSWLYYGYVGERLNLFEPHVLEGLFGFQKGWLVYTPLMALSLTGLFLFGRSTPWLARAIGLLVAVHVFVAFAWPEWWYGAGFGARTMIQCYAVLALPMASCVEWMAARRTAWAVVVMAVGLNLFQTWQLHSGILHATHMHRAAYVETFGAWHLTAADEQRLYPEEAHRWVEAELVRDAARAPTTATTLVTLAGLGALALSCLVPWTRREGDGLRRPTD